MANLALSKMRAHPTLGRCAAHLSTLHSVSSGLSVILPLDRFTGRHCYLTNGIKQELFGEPSRERKPEIDQVVVMRVVQDAHQNEHVNSNGCRCAEQGSCEQEGPGRKLARYHAGARC